MIVCLQDYLHQVRTAQHEEYSLVLTNGMQELVGHKYNSGHCWQQNNIHHLLPTKQYSLQSFLTPYIEKSKLKSSFQYSLYMTINILQHTLITYSLNSTHRQFYKFKQSIRPPHFQTIVNLISVKKHFYFGNRIIKFYKIDRKIYIEDNLHAFDHIRLYLGKTILVLRLRNWITSSF